MIQNRSPRFTRVFKATSLKLTTRDTEIINLFFRHRFLRSTHIVSLIGGSHQQILRRLKLLYHQRFLERPPCQIDSYYKAGSQPFIYGLGDKGGALLQAERGSVPALLWGEKNHEVRAMFFEHAMLIADVMVALELACRAQGVKLLTEDDFSLPGKRPFQWKLNFSGGFKVSVIPDRVFALEFTNANGEPERAYFFLEADRGTMPVKRKTFSQTSFYRKLIAYEATWTQNLHQQFGFHRFRVLTITSIPGRVKSLVEACSQLERGHGLFLFADKSILSGDILSAVIQNGKANPAISFDLAHQSNLPVSADLSSSDKMPVEAGSFLRTG